MLMVLKRSFQGRRGMETLRHCEAGLLWKAGAFLTFGALLFAFLGSLGLKVFFPSVILRMGILVMPMAWMFFQMPILLLLQIISGKRGLEADRLFLASAMSAFAFFLFFPPILLAIPLIPETPIYFVLGFMSFLIGIAWSAILLNNSLVVLLGTTDGLSSIKSAGIVMLSFFIALAVWVMLFKDLAEWDPTYFLG